MRHVLMASVAVVALTLTLMAQEPSPQQQDSGRLPAKLSGEFTPLATPDIANRPVPRLPDGHPDLSGPWVGGGSNNDIEKDGGLKPGELPLLPWAKQLRESRKEEDEPYLYCTPMSVPRVNPYPWRFETAPVLPRGPRRVGYVAVVSFQNLLNIAPFERSDRFRARASKIRYLVFRVRGSRGLAGAEHNMARKNLRP